MILRIASILARLATGAFFAFVGCMKAFAPLANLARYHAWTVFLPEAAGRAVGWSEIACAAALLLSLAPRFGTAGRIAALILLANQACAAAVHAAHGQADALPQNALLAALFALIAWELRRTPTSKERHHAI